MSKTATFPSLRVDAGLRQAAEDVLDQGESLSGFIEQSVRESVHRRQVQQAFLARGLAAREEARQTGVYVSSADVIQNLEQRLVRAKAAKSKAGA